MAGNSLSDGLNCKRRLTKKNIEVVKKYCRSFPCYSSLKATLKVIAEQCLVELTLLYKIHQRPSSKAFVSAEFAQEKRF